MPLRLAFWTRSGDGCRGRPQRIFRAGGCLRSAAGRTRFASWSGAGVDSTSSCAGCREGIVGDFLAHRAARSNRLLREGAVPATPAAPVQRLARLRG